MQVCFTVVYGDVIIGDLLWSVLIGARSVFWRVVGRIMRIVCVYNRNRDKYLGGKGGCRRGRGGGWVDVGDSERGVLASCVSCLCAAEEACSAVNGCVGCMASFLRDTRSIGHHDCLTCGHRGTGVKTHCPLVDRTVYSLLRRLGVKCGHQRRGVGALRELSTVSRGGEGLLGSFVI